MMLDIFTKNLPLQTLEKHGKEFYGDDEYYYERYKENASASKDTAAAAMILATTQLRPMHTTKKFSERSLMLLNTCVHVSHEAGRMRACELRGLLLGTYNWEGR